MTKENGQLGVCQRFGAGHMPPEENEKVGIALGSLGKLPLNALRINPENGASGWYIYGGESSDGPDFYQPLHIAHLVDRCPKIVPYLALPPGWRVLLAPEYEDVWFDSVLIDKLSDGD
ncbi:immunity protein Imm33 domain-containing protein [Undibacterium aquatile]|uniref:Imm33-like domain-containing protein n=1 Tax=Undibacterium aquatile TaxID=1537398 RepID=A0ABR6XDN3_9BURK|nr:hypothetical protein [Undibacterium aquatile]MBC3810700.1 hypothetical protein [Undibacterium aquatile]